MSFINARRFSMYTRFLASFLIVLIIPLAASIFLYFYASDQLRDEIWKTNTAALNQFIYQFEANFNTAYKTINQINMDSNTIKYKDNDARRRMLSGYDTYMNNKFLYSLKMDYLEDIFIYYHNSDKVVSTYNSTLPSKLYYETVYRGMDQYILWKNMLRSPNNYTVIHIDNKGSKTLAIAQSISLSDIKNASATAVCVLNGSYISNLMKSYKELTQGGIAIFDRNSNILISSDKTYELVDPGNDGGSSGYYYETLNGHRYVVQSVKSEITTCKYVFAVPVTNYWARLVVFRSNTVISILFFTVLGLLIVWLLARKNYQPISKLVNFMLNSTNKTYKHESLYEIDYISHVFKSTYLEKEKLTHQLNSIHSIEQKNFLTNIFHGSYPKNSQLYDAFANNNVHLLSDMFIVIICKIESWDRSIIPDIFEEIIEKSNDNKSTIIIEVIIGNVLEELCAKKHNGLILHTEKDIFVCLVNLSSTYSSVEQYETDMKSICQTAKQFYEKEMGIYCTMSFSRAHKDFEGIRASYMEALTTLEYRIVYGERSLLSYKVIDNSDFRYNYDFRIMAENVLISYIKTGKPACSDVLDNIIMACFADGKISPETAKIFIYDMSNIIRKVTNTLSMQSYFDSSNSSYSDLMLCETISQYKEQLILVLTELYSLYQSNQKPNEFSQKIIDFMSANYIDENLNVNMIGYIFNISPSYCSKIFKQQTGLGIHDYISKIRIENSRVLLKETNLNIEEISSRVGFMSSTVFIRTFKKSEGVTPGAYRKMHCTAIAAKYSSI